MQEPLKDTYPLKFTSEKTEELVKKAQELMNEDKLEYFHGKYTINGMFKVRIVCDGCRQTDMPDIKAFLSDFNKSLGRGITKFEIGYKEKLGSSYSITFDVEPK